MQNSPVRITSRLDGVTCPTAALSFSLYMYSRIPLPRRTGTESISSQCCHQCCCSGCNVHVHVVLVKDPHTHPGPPDSGPPPWTLNQDSPDPNPSPEYTTLHWRSRLMLTPGNFVFGSFLLKYFDCLNWWVVSYCISKCVCVNNYLSFTKGCSLFETKNCCVAGSPQKESI